jgi:type II secretory pathway component GspD/PulD (secretin)
LNLHPGARSHAPDHARENIEPMKIYSLVVTALMLVLGAGCTRLESPASAPAPACVTAPESAPPKPTATYSSFDLGDTKKTIAAGMIKFQDADVSQVLAVYQELSGRTLIHSPQVPRSAKITLENATALTRAEALQMFDNALAAHQIVMVYLGTSYVKVVTTREAPSEAGPVFDGPWRQLPDSSSFVIYVTKLKTLKAEDAIAVLSPYAKLPNSLLAVKGSDVLVLRDYSSNVRRMMDVLERLEASQSEVKTK